MNPRLAILFGTLISVPCEAAEPTAEQAGLFETRIRPVLVEHCHRCHSEDAERLKAGLKLDSLAGAPARWRSGSGTRPRQTGGEPAAGGHWLEDARLANASQGALA